MSDAPATTITPCERCNGWGVLREKDATLTCPTCHGTALSVGFNDTRFVAILPQSIPVGSTAVSLRWNGLKPWLLRGVILVTILLGIRIALLPTTTTTTKTSSKTTDLVQTRQSPSQNPISAIRTRFHTDTGATQLFFYIGIAATIYLLFAQQQGKRASHSLLDLQPTTSQPQHIHYEPDGSIDVLPYFSGDALAALDQTILMAEKIGTHTITPELLVSALLCSGKTAVIVARLEKDPAASCKLFLSTVTAPKDRSDQVVFDPDARALLIKACIEAYTDGFDSVDPEDILLVAAREDGPIKDQLEQMEFTYDQLRSVARWQNEEDAAIAQWQFWRQRGRTRPKGYMNRAWTARPTPFLDKYSRDFTQLASLGRLPVVKVRNQQIEAAIRILGGGDKNNVLLVGEPGVGKTSIVGAIAERMVEDTVPEPLKDKRLIELNLSALVSGGRSEKQNMDQILQEVTVAGNVIIFIGHVEALVSKEGGLSAAALLEAASKSSSIQIIGTATYGDYHRYIESNPAFSNSFQKVEVPEVSDEDAITIIEEESPGIQSKYHVLLTYPAIKEAVTLSRRLIPDQVLPEKALDVLSEAAQIVNGKKELRVTKKVIQEVLSRRTNVPVEDVTGNERDRLMHLAETMRGRVIGQDEAVEKVTEALRRARTGLKDEKRPIGSFLFVGPTGVGKTETARTLAGTYFGNRDAMNRIDMSEYQDARAIYRLIGAPASSAEEFTEGGALTKAVRERPYSIVLLDEIEKAHPDVLNLFLQMLDDGRLTENTGRTVSFANTIIIATSNAGASEIATAVSSGTTGQELTTLVQNLLTKQFRPEFINRFDAVITFKPLTAENVESIARIMLAEVAQHLKEQGIDATFGNDVVAYVSRVGFDPKFGARPLRRAIQDSVETKLADLLLSDTIDKKQKIVITSELLGLPDTPPTPTGQTA